MMGLIERPAYADILLVEHIRNNFVHRLECKSFDHPKVAKDVQKFSMNAVSRVALKQKHTEPPLKSLFLMALYSIVDRALALPSLDPTTVILRPL